MDDLIPIIVVLLLVIGGVVKRLAERLGTTRERDEHPRPDYEASPQEIRAFLESLGMPKRAQAQPPASVQQLGPREGPSVLLAEPLRAEPEAAQVSLRSVGTLYSPELLVPVPAPAKAPPQRARRAKRAAAPAPAPKLAQPVPAAQVAKRPAVPMLALDRSRLRQAVIWSEVLGRPVSLRGQRAGEGPGPMDLQGLADRIPPRRGT